MQKYPDFWSVLIGERPGLLFGFIIIAAIAAIAMMFIEANGRDKSSDRTPSKFSIKFWFADNALRIPGTLLLIYLAVRGCYAYVPETWMLFLSMGIGFGSDGLAIVGKKMGLLTTNKLAAKIKEKLSTKTDK